jgi:hypothetical protein
LDNDLILVLGIVIFAFSIPSVIAAFSESRPPRLAAILFVIGGGMIAYAISKTPGGIGFGDIPQVFARVIGRFTQ